MIRAPTEIHRYTAMPLKIWGVKMKGDEMNDAEVIERLTRVEERSKSNTHRLDELEPVVKEIHTMSETMVRLVTEVKHTNQTVAEIKEKVEEQEKLPATRLEQIKTAIIAAIASGLITGAVTIIFF